MTSGETRGLRGFWGELIMRHPRKVCELCGAVITDGSERYGAVPDPTARYPRKPEWDGTRIAVACSVEHMVELSRRAEGPAAGRPGRPAANG